MEISKIFKSEYDIDWNYVMSFQEFQALENCQHSIRWHKEGNPLNHTKLVVDEAIKLCKGYPYHAQCDPKVLITAALFHDIGKPSTTYWSDEKNDWGCKSHGAAGELITRELLWNESIVLREEICWLVRWHMEFHHFLEKSPEEQGRKMMRLGNGISSVFYLLMLNYCDSVGSVCEGNDTETIKARLEKIKELAINFDCLEHNIKPENFKYDFEVIFMVGLPGSGKDAYIKNHYPDYPTVCRDDVREELQNGKVEGKKLLFDNEGENKVTEICNGLIEKYCKEHKSFVINQTNLKRKYRQEIGKLIYAHSLPWIKYVYVEAPSIDTCIERRKGQIEPSIIRNMFDKFEFPDCDECNELIIAKGSDKAFEWKEETYPKYTTK